MCMDFCIRKTACRRQLQLQTVTSVASRCPAHHFIQKSHHRQKIIWTADVSHSSVSRRKNTVYEPQVAWKQVKKNSKTRMCQYPIVLYYIVEAQKRYFCACRLSLHNPAPSQRTIQNYANCINTDNTPNYYWDIAHYMKNQTRAWMQKQ